MANTGVDDSERRTAVRWTGAVIVVLILIWLVASRTGTRHPSVVAGGQAPAVSGGEVAPAPAAPTGGAKPGPARPATGQR
jgi:hypothetical protein